jgi:hypothetical protein
MSKVTQLFSIEELKRLHPKDFDALRDRILHHLRTSPEIRRILKRKLRPEFERRLKPKARKRRRGKK